MTTTPNPEQAQPDSETKPPNLLIGDPVDSPLPLTYTAARDDGYGESDDGLPLTEDPEDG